MRDYSFGNHLANLREEKGYSQYRFGKLLGVTDKAVSKWENGVSKPKLNVCLKMADILGVSIDDLLCQRNRDLEEVQNTMKKRKAELWKKAEKRLYEVYGDSPPLIILSRLEIEKIYFQNSDSIILFDIMSYVQKLFAENNSFLIPRGHANSSFTAWLLGATFMNPLPAHTYCPKCHKVTFYPQTNDGWDLYGQSCECGESLIQDGHNLVFEAVYSTNSNPFFSFDCSIPMCMEDEAWDIILKKASKLYSLERHTVEDKLNGNLVTRVLFLSGKDNKPYGSLSDIPTISDEQYWSRLNTVSSICLIPNNKLDPENLIGRWRTLPDIKSLLQRTVIKRAYNIHLREFLNEDNREYEKPLSLTCTPTCFSDLLKMIAALHGSYTFENINDLTEFLHMSDCMALPLTREEVWRLVENYTDHESEAGIAALITNKLSRGLYATAYSEKDKTLFNRLRLPEWFDTFARNVYYLFPLCHCVAYAYLDLIEAWRTIDAES